jgi:hypothetical protein
MRHDAITHRRPIRSRRLRPQRKAEARSFWHGVARIFVVWLVEAAVLAASEALREMSAPAASAAAQTTPHTNGSVPWSTAIRTGHPSTHPG